MKGTDGKLQRNAAAGVLHPFWKKNENIKQHLHDERLFRKCIKRMKTTPYHTMNHCVALHRTCLVFKSQFHIKCR